jgi:hypothetical protein
MLNNIAAQWSVRSASYLGRLEKAQRRPDRGDISITTVIIWVAATAAALTVAGTIALVVAKYNGKLLGV